MKRYHNWYKLQQDFQGWKGISPDKVVLDRIREKNWSIDLRYCHFSLQQALANFESKNNRPDFFIMSDLEIGKLPLDVVFKMIKQFYDNSKFGGYIAILSYYLNVRKPDRTLTGSFKQNIETVFSRNLSYVSNLENLSTVNDYPINTLENGVLLEGTNFIFVHPNIRYFLWKQ